MTDAFRHFHWNTFPIYFLFALLFFIIGLGIGWLLWRNSRERVADLDDDNGRLRRAYEDLKQAISS